MYLKKLELQGFKSFADKTTLQFKPGITVVIGPNGSGKSNISDSIRWVLGEQSMKSLRGQTSADIIFAGTQNRKSLGFAEASIVIDNQDGRLPIEYNEVTVTRKIYRSGETGYFINKVPCRLKDILELFMDTGIGKDGYSIIGQGRIDEILSNKSEDRRRIFEEAAGIVKFRTRKLESEKKLEQTKLNLLRINDILSEIEANIEPLKMQSEKAKKFLNLKEELKDIEVGLFIYHIEDYKQKLEQIIKDNEILENQYQEEENKKQKMNSLKEELKLEIDRLTLRVEEMQNEKNASANQMEKMNSEIEISKERIENNVNNSKRFEIECEELQTRIKQLEEEKEQKNVKKENLIANREKFKKELEEKEQKLEELNNKLSKEELKIEEKKKKVQESIDNKYEIASEINMQDANWENYEKRKNTVKQEQIQTISELDAVRTEKNEKTKEFTSLENARNELLQELQKEVEKYKTYEKTIAEYTNKINAKNYEKQMKTSRLQFLQETEREKEGYVKSVKNLLLVCEKDEKLNNGVHGVLANLISVKKEYETAIEICLGTNLQNIVTETEEDAKKLIEYLRENHLGRASFLPISTMKSNLLDKIEDNGIEGVIGIASNLVSCDKKYAEIVKNLLGKTVIVDDMENAIKLARKNKHKFKIVTLKGDVINPSGVMSGGSVQTKTVNILGRGRELEDLTLNLNNIKEELANIEKEKEEYIASMNGIKENKAEVEKKLQEMEIEYATEKQKMINIDENIQKLQERLEKLRQEEKQLEEKKQENRTLKLQKEEEINKINEIVENLNKEIQEFSSKNKESQKIIDDLNFDITNLKISVFSFDESNMSIEEMLERIEQDKKNAETSIQNKQIEIRQIQSENIILNEKIESLKDTINEMKKQIEESEIIVESDKQERQEKSKKLLEKEDEIIEQFKVLEGLKEQIVKVEAKKNKIEQDIEQIVNELWDEYELTPNTSNEYKKPSNIAQATKQVQNLRSEIHSLGSVNMDSIEEYKKTKERYDFMCEQRLDLDNTAGKLRKIISEMTENMKEQFKEKFEIINHNFNEVFCELFGGGKAELILEDENNLLECGIDIRVQPPGKKLQNMMLLSGGEKAFTAIALLFAILKINPAPFCILDEIEAALDDVNVYRYAEYLKKFSKETQFLVISHRKGTMEAADTVYGITMEENGISKLLSMKF